MVLSSVVHGWSSLKPVLHYAQALPLGFANFTVFPRTGKLGKTGNIGFGLDSACVPSKTVFKIRTFYEEISCWMSHFDIQTVLFYEQSPHNDIIQLSKLIRSLSEIYLS